MKKISIILTALLALSACCGGITDTQHTNARKMIGNVWTRLYDAI